jgi:hypothetical protein
MSLHPLPWLTTSLVIAALGLPCEAQEQAPVAGAPGGSRARVGRFDGGYSRLGDVMSNFLMVMNPAVQADLRLTDIQKGKLKSLYEQVDRKHRALMRTRLDRPGSVERGGDRPQRDDEAYQDPAVRRAAFLDISEKLDLLRLQTDAAISKILNKGQQQRLTQIALRKEGFLSAISRPEIQEKLYISQEQTAEISVILAEATRAREELGQVDRSGPSLHDRTVLQVSKVLTGRQRARWTAMIGKDFDVSLLKWRPGEPPSVPEGSETAKSVGSAAEPRPADVVSKKRGPR